MFKAMIKKELLLVLRDKHALLALFVLPAIFILIMSVAMRDQFSTKNINFTLFVVDKENNAMSKKLCNSLITNKSFHLLKEKKAAQFIVTIPKDYSKDAKKRIEIYVQDSIKENEIKAFEAIFSEYIYKVRFDKISTALKQFAPQVAKELNKFDFSTAKLYKIQYNDSQLIPNSTQQSVPAWIVFGMFFVIIPMSTIYVNERKQNTLARLNSMNVSVFHMTLTKSIPYLLINQLQVWIMIGVGLYIVPLFNTPALELNGSIFAIFEIAIALSITAIGISTLIAVSANSSEQATTIGGISNILLGAIGGVMVPKFIMPESMQYLAQFSPMAWGLDGFLKIFLMAADTSSVLNDFLKLTAFGLISLIISMVILQRRIKQGL